MGKFDDTSKTTKHELIPETYIRTELRRTNVKSPKYEKKA